MSDCDEGLPGRYDPLAPAFAWEIPVTPVTLVSAALSAGRPGGLAERRLNGLSDGEVASHYQELRRLVLAHARAGGASLTRFEQLERSEPDVAPSRWETWVVVSGASEHVEVIQAARGVWEALGPNEYARFLKARPRTSRGFVEGRLWVVGGVAPTMLLIVSGIGVSGDLQRGTLVAAGVLWPLLVVVAFRRRRRRLDRVGGAELPHL